MVYRCGFEIPLASHFPLSLLELTLAWLILVLKSESGSCEGRDTQLAGQGMRAGIHFKVTSQS